ncbi:Oligopeptide transport ATP-binding protein OppD [Dissulfuribacter thermophilus]|uniref:Oligopeptide transport ATP-binding protein OppD n=1 Tax=Dissulfuribacter thermophilus TaxID=1156395 RepID=A0A1B9F728_9BACT|nr:ABC transporter ATP-binding protein [Dissulfuribacter thermophilus]OCC15726.1 Oligopeptide transport ATP-binding protein OppD [Dissulfuribacter thermophilus]
MIEKKVSLLRVDNFTLSFKKGSSRVPLLKGLSFFVNPGESLCIVGESGCGKTLTSRSILGLIDQKIFEIDSGEILFKGQNILKLNEKDLIKIRGKEIAMIFQEPMTALNPVFTIGQQIEEMLTIHLGLTKQHARSKIIELLKAVGIPDPEYRMHSYPHELSGGMRQRAMIAMAISCNPSLLIADEPTTALDVTVQAQILSLLKRLKQSNNMALILITHDLGIVSTIANRVIIMYAGYIVEEASVSELFSNPLHPYTQGLLKAIPYEINCEVTQKRRLESIPGNVPSMDEIGTGCPFQPRCKKQMPMCSERLPQLKTISKGQRVRCHYYN